MTVTFKQRQRLFYWVVGQVWERFRQMADATRGWRRVVIYLWKLTFDKRLTFIYCPLCQAEARPDCKSTYTNATRYQTNKFFLHRNCACLFTERNVEDLYFSTLLWPSYTHPPSRLSELSASEHVSLSSSSCNLNVVLFWEWVFIDETDLAASKQYCRHRADLCWFPSTKK